MELIRGDSLPLKFQRLDADAHPITVPPSEMYFTMKPSYKIKECVVQKTLADMTYGEDDFWHFKLNPSDTESLPYGRYFCDIEVTDDGEVNTISRFVIDLLEEATWRDNK